MIVVTQNRIKNYSAGILCDATSCVFCSSQLPQVLSTIAKYIVLVCSMFSSSVLLSQTSIYRFQNSIHEYEIDPLTPSYARFEAKQIGSYVTQGFSFQESGHYDKALVVFQKAWEMDRIQNGLYSASQVPIIENIISNYVELEKWNAVNDQFEYLEYLYGRIYQVDDPKFELGLQKISSWHITALNENLDGRRLMHLRKVHNLFKTRLNIARSTLDSEDPIFEYLSENIGLSKRQLYLYSDMGSEIAYAQFLPSGRGMIVNLD